MKEKLLNWLDTFLVADVFLVIIGFAWFAIAVIGHSISKVAFTFTNINS
ncbi:MAG: hypothetical protein F6K39_29935, partial [Okeania sp. SIO3B3]|nr:hypothetical protein [Okeania sp. SIO3B3]